MNLDKVKVTINKDLYDYKNCRTIQLKTFVNNTKNGKYKTITKQHRKRLVENDYDDYLKRALPKVLIDGEYKERSHEGLVEFNGLLLFDADDVVNKELFIELILKTKPFILFESTSGDIKFGYVTDVYDVKYYELAYKHIMQELDKFLKIYKDLNNIDYKLDYISYALGTFVSYDPNIYYDNENYRKIEVFDKIKDMYVEDFNTNKKYKGNGKNNNKKLDKVLSFLNKNGICLTENYYDWQNIAIAIYNDIKDFDDASYYFYEFSKTYRKFKTYEYEREVKKFELLVKNNALANNMGIGSIIYKAKQYGFKLN